jgi:site-specific DNA-adenine methylase
MRYGVPYKGSKNALAEKLCAAIPHRGFTHFYDLFAGGCAVTHRMLFAGGFQYYHINDLDDAAPRLFLAAVSGKYRDEKRWISREDFALLKDTDPYVSISWSFGNNRIDYLYSKEIEPYKRAAHYAIVFGEWEETRRLCPEIAPACETALAGLTDTKERRIEFGRAAVRWLKANATAETIAANPLYRSCHLRKANRKECPTYATPQSLQRLESLESLQSLGSLESLERLESTTLPYDEVKIEPNSVIYCDPPYKGMTGYAAGTGKGKRCATAFDFARFYDWCERQTELVLISEYEMPADRFACVWAAKHLVRCAANVTTHTTERVFTPLRQKETYERLMKEQTASLF